MLNGNSKHLEDPKTALNGHTKCLNAHNGTAKHQDLEGPPTVLTGPKRNEHEEFLKAAFDLILNQGLFEGINREQPVCRFLLPEDLRKSINLDVGKEPVASHRDLLDLLEKVFKYSVKTAHPYFVNQLYSGMDTYGFVGEIVAASLNSSVYTYEVSPVFTLMEMEVLEKMRNLVGFPEAEGDGLFCPGGSIANGYAISASRYQKRPSVKTEGLSGGKAMVMFCSVDAHYSMAKLASFEGIGSGNVIGIDVDERGKMIPEVLEKRILKCLEEDKEPFLVCATSGTTVLGAFDPLTSVGEICRKYDLWFHVDAAWGGGALMSAAHKKLLTGIEHADSVTWNPHKLFCAPQQCSVFLTRHDKIMTECHETRATYLFQQDKFYDSSRFDTGDKYIQCGRRADVLKFWLMWKAKGTKGFQEHINHLWKLAKYTRDQVQARDGFQLVIDQPECTNVSFWYIPSNLRHLRIHSQEFYKVIHQVAPKIKERMMKSGSMMCTYQPLRNLPNFFRIVYQSSELSRDDVDYFLNTIEKHGEEIQVSNGVH